MSASPRPEEAVPPETAATNTVGTADLPGFEASEGLLEDAVAQPAADVEAEAEETPRQRLAFPPRPQNPPSNLVPTVHAEESGSENEDDGLGHLAAEDSGSDSDDDAEEAYAPDEDKPKKKRSRKSGSGEVKERKKKEKRAERPAEDPEDEDMEPTYDEATRASSL